MRYYMVLLTRMLIFILDNIENKNGVKEYINKILSDIEKSKDKLKEINDKINADKQ